MEARSEFSNKKYPTIEMELAIYMELGLYLKNIQQSHGRLINKSKKSKFHQTPFLTLCPGRIFREESIGATPAPRK